MHLAAKEIPDSGPRMGRRPLGKSADDTKATLVRLEEAMRDRIKAVRGDRSMAKFIREAVEEKLAREEAATPPQA